MMFTYTGTLLQYTGYDVYIHRYTITVHWRFTYTGTLLQYTGGFHTLVHYYSTLEDYIHRTSRTP